MQKDLLRVEREDMKYDKQILNKVNPEINFEVRKMERQLKLRGKDLCCLHIAELQV